MVTDLVAPILDLVARYGLRAIFVLLVLDAAMLLPLVPGELLLIYLATRYAHDAFSLALFVLFGAVAATLGNLLLYGIARGGGRPFFERHPRLFFMTPRRRDQMERLFQRPAGQSLVLLLRLLPLVRLLVNIPAGLARMPVVRFVVLTFLGNLLFHTGFMWLAYESGQPGSAVASHANELRDGYANPAWDYVRANWVATAAVLLALGIVLSIRASMRGARQPGEPFRGSLLGTLSTLVLFWGGMSILVGLWIDPPLVYDTLTLSGYDLRTVALGVPFEPLSVAATLGGVAILLGLLLSSARRSARRRVKTKPRPPTPMPIQR